MYQQIIREALAESGATDVQPAHVEAWMRVNHATLDGLSPAEWRREFLTAVDCARDAGPEMSELLAVSFGIPDRRAEVAARK